MPKTLPANIILAKNKTSNENPWLMLIDIDIDGTIIRLANNNDNVTFQSNTYQAFKFNIDAIKNSSGGKLNGVSLSVSNVEKTLSTYLEDTNGLVNSTVTLYIVNSALLTEDYSELTMYFTIMGATVDETFVTFILSTPSPLKKRFPQDKYIARYCNWTFNSPAVRAAGTNAGVECGYLGADTTCERTKDACELKANLPKFGGYPGLVEDGLRIIY